jgi:hypothetical protein
MPPFLHCANAYTPPVKTSMIHSSDEEKDKTTKNDEQSENGNDNDDDDNDDDESDVDLAEQVAKKETY